MTKSAPAMTSRWAFRNICHDVGRSGAGSDLLHDPGMPDPSLDWVSPLGCDETAMPGQDGIWSHDGGELAEELPTEDLALRCEPSTLIIGEPQALSEELLLENAVLLTEGVDHLALLPVDPAGERRKKELKVDRGGLHAQILPDLTMLLSRGRIERSSFRTVRVRGGE